MHAHTKVMNETVSTGQDSCALDCMKRGECFRVQHIDDEMARITALRFGITEGSTASCITRLPAGPVIIKSGRQEIAVGRGLARRISVFPLCEEGTDVR